MSGAYRVSQEPWWFTSAINEFKLRYSYGTAGGRPSFSDQYETFSVASGVVSKATLGNKKLKPEFATEQEAGVDFALFDKVSLELTYAKSVIEDQLLAVPLPGFYGFASQWQNAGTLESNTYEANLHGSLLRTGNMNWSASLIFDRTRQKITEFDLPAYRWGPEQAFYNRKGEIFGVMYGRPWITSRDELPANITSRDQFQVNDDGYLVAVGSGNNWTDGVAKNMWGKKVTIDGVTYDWGMPIAYVDAKRSDFHKIGNVTPDFSLGLSSTFRWKGLSLYALFDAQIGGDIYNLTRQWSYRELRHGDVDQAGKPAEKKKPIDYYSRLYATNAMNSHFVEDGTYVKFRELNVSYTLDRGRLQKLFGGFFEGLFHRVTVGVIGRNLLTWSDYSGFDPEVGNYFGGNLDATLVRFDGFGYPNFRTFTGVLELEF